LGGQILRWRFGDFQLDVPERQLFRRDERVHLTPKAFDLLRLLIEERPRAVSKSELQEHLWPSTFVVEANLSSLVAEVRSALGDRARQPATIRTVHGFGYAFVGTLTEVPSAKSSEPATCWLVSETAQIRLRPGDNLVGRDPAAVVWIDNTSVSRRHARIVVSLAGTLLEDLESRNGTWVGNVRISETTALAGGETVRFGSVSFTYRQWTDLSTTKALTDSG
jgi:DNA-binding winged helix-turn-helix (wHTH) protein